MLGAGGGGGGRTTGGLGGATGARGNGVLAISGFGTGT
jgi:hypothetical protein